MILEVVVTPGAELALTNALFCSDGAFRSVCAARNVGDKKSVLVKVQAQAVNGGSVACIFTLHNSSKVPDGKVAFNSAQREFLKIALDTRVSIELLTSQSASDTLSSANIEVSLLKKAASNTKVEIDVDVLKSEVLSNYTSHFLFLGQKLLHRYTGRHLISLQVVESTGGVNDNGLIAPGGQLTDKTTLLFERSTKDFSIKFTGKSVTTMSTTTSDLSKQISGMNFEKLGIGGLDSEFTEIFRRAFASRIYPAEVVRRLGTKHVKGLMLHGPPGCGKTLIARQISRVLQGESTEDSKERNIKIVSGPEVLNKYVGGSEEKVRELFKEAEEDEEKYGDESELHVIIFDEIDAICKQRGNKRDSTGVGDSVVNQLLAKIDGVNALNNILLIGMTNRLDMIDSALLRPGRFEVHIEIGLPTLSGRKQILNIHTKKMRNSGALESGVSMDRLAEKTKNFSGAEIEGLVKSAASFAYLRHTQSDGTTMGLKNIDDFKVTSEDFEMALGEVKPAFGVQKEEELQLYFRNGVIQYSKEFSDVYNTVIDLTKQVRVSDKTPLLSVLVSGATGSGKSAFVAKIASESEFPFVKVVSADTFIGYSEQERSSKLVSLFEDAYKSPLSLIILDDLERLIDFVALGPRFANSVLQALLVLINKHPPKMDRKLMIIGTTAIPSLLGELGLSEVFNVVLDLPLLQTEEEIGVVLGKMEPDIDEREKELISKNCVVPIAVKRFLVVLEMAKQLTETGSVTCDAFLECLKNVGY